MSEFRLLTLSAWHTHKNIDIIPHIIDCLPDKLKKTIRFVVTLPEKTFQKFIASQHRGLILNVGPVKPKEGPSLYKECDALFLPTLLECFSASYPEAMAMEKPIITTDLGFARSICGNAALFFEPTDPKSASNKILQLYHNEDLQKELIMAGKKQLKNFDSPKKRAIKYLNLCKKLVDEGKN